MASKIAGYGGMAWLEMAFKIEDAVNTAAAVAVAWVVLAVAMFGNTVIRVKASARKRC